MFRLVKASRFLPVLLVLAIAACGSNHRPGEVPIPYGAKVTHKAVFIGKAYHDTVGTISLYQSEHAPVVVFEKNFKLPGGKGTIITLGRNGVNKRASLGPLQRDTGRQSYAVPDHLPISNFNEIWLWHSGKNIAVGLARLTPI
jgi:hypothetical protein